MLMSCVRGHERECTEAVLGFWAIFAAIIGACFVPWRRIFSRDFWTHPTIDEMQAEMLREVWAEWQCRKIERNMRLFAIAIRVNTDSIGGTIERTKEIIDSFKRTGPFGTRKPSEISMRDLLQKHFQLPHAEDL